MCYPDITTGTPHYIGRPRWLIRSGCGSKRRGTGFESRPVRMFVIEVVHVQCSRLFKGLEYTGMPMVLSTIKTPEVIRK